MMRNIFILTAILICVSIAAAQVYWDDGLSHVINDATYGSEFIYLDWNVVNNPGTHLELMAGASLLGGIRLHHNATLNMSGSDIGGVVAYDNAHLVKSGGTNCLPISAGSNASIIMTGGHANALIVSDNAVASFSGGDVMFLQANGGRITVSGGRISTSGGGSLSTSFNGIIYLDGTNFAVNGQSLSYGDKLSDFVPLVEYRVGDQVFDYYAGTVTGTLADGSTLNNQFQICNTGYYAGDGDIIIIPEPATLLLMTLGALLIRKKTSNLKPQA